MGLYTNPAAQCLRQPVGAGASSPACSSFEAILKRRDRTVVAAPALFLAQRRNEIIVECCVVASLVRAEWSRKLGLRSQDRAWRAFDRATNALAVESTRVEPGQACTKGTDARLSDTIGLRRCCWTRKGGGKGENTAENAGGLPLRERMCILTKKQAETGLIGNTTGHADGGKANCFDPERTSPVHQIWARDLSSGAPVQG